MKIGIRKNIYTERNLELRIIPRMFNTKLRRAMAL